jgi:hypothetical protein
VVAALTDPLTERHLASLAGPVLQLGIGEPDRDAVVRRFLAAWRAADGAGFGHLVPGSVDCFGSSRNRDGPQSHSVLSYENEWPRYQTHRVACAQSLQVLPGGNWLMLMRSMMLSVG